jgi:hypothetical protein
MLLAMMLAQPAAALSESVSLMENLASLSIALRMAPREIVESS